MRTDDEVREEIERLKSLIPVGIHKRGTQVAIEAAVEELSCGVDDTCEEFDLEPSIVQECVQEARRWKEGGADRPSDGFGQLVDRQRPGSAGPRER